MSDTRTETQLTKEMLLIMVQKDDFEPTKEQEYLCENLKNEDAKYQALLEAQKNAQEELKRIDQLVYNQAIIGETTLNLLHGMVVDANSIHP